LKFIGHGITDALMFGPDTERTFHAMIDKPDLKHAREPATAIRFRSQKSPIPSPASSGTNRNVSRRVCLHRLVRCAAADRLAVRRMPPASS
jgi:hypothetical protein